MLIAINKNGGRVAINEASTNEDYYCPLCNEILVQKRGIKRCHHFAHKSGGMCSESKYLDMCAWHINWQEKFPKDNIEVIKVNGDGKKHIADVLMNNVEIEFQHSYMPYGEFDDRNNFYKALGYHVIWIFDGNDVFNKGYNDGPFPFSKRFECLKKYAESNLLDVFIEGNVQKNLFNDGGLFLHHVGNIDETKGIMFDCKCKIDEFIKSIYNKEPINYIFDDNTEVNIGIQEEISDEDVPCGTVLDILNYYPSAKYLIVYNTKTKYDVLIDKYNLNRVKEGKFIFGKIKKHGNYGGFKNEPTEIYYVKDPIWIYQKHY